MQARIKLITDWISVIYIVEMELGESLFNLGETKVLDRRYELIVDDDGPCCCCYCNGGSGRSCLKWKTYLPKDVLEPLTIWPVNHDKTARSCSTKKF
jgi:hypothetical protein